MKQKSLIRLMALSCIVIQLIGCSPKSQRTESLQEIATNTPLPSSTPGHTPEEEYRQPEFSSIPSQWMLPAETEIEIDLSEYLYETEPSMDEISWSAQVDPTFSVTFNGPLMQIERETINWMNNQTIPVQACNTAGMCAHADINLLPMGTLEDGIMHTQIDGIIITTGGMKIMIDTLFISPDGTNPKFVEAMYQALPPYNDADLILITHHHRDHFDANLVINNMLNNPEAVLVSTNKVIRYLKNSDRFNQIADRVIGMQLVRGEFKQLAVAGVDLEVMYFSHGDEEETPNFGYLFTINGITYFHIGDIVMDIEPVNTLIKYGLPEINISYAFVPYFMLIVDKYKPHATEGIQAAYYVPVHLGANEKESGRIFERLDEMDFNFVAFRQDYSWYPLEREE